MACPNCGCKETYYYDDEYYGEYYEDSGLERCAACGYIFDVEDALPDDEDG